MQLTLYDKNGREKVRFSPSDSSTQTKEIQGDNVLGLSFTLYEFVAIDVNDYIDYEGERYRALEKYKPSEKSTVEWEYSVQFYGVESLIKRFLVLNNTDGDNEAVFTLTDKPSVHLALIVQCINEGMASMGTARWVAGAIADNLNAENVVIDYHGKYCDEALRELAEAVGSEWYVEGTTVSIGRCEFGEPLTLGYGEGKGLTSLDRDRADNAKFYTRLFPIGSSRNIDPSDYNGHTRLQLPGGAKFVDVNTDEYGIIHHYEQEAFSGIYPRRIGEVASVRTVQTTSDDGTPYTIYHFKDNGLDFNPDDYMMAGKVLRVSFQDGEMAGLGESDDHYFEVNWHNDTREFEIITIWPYGNDIQLPGGNLIPKRGDHYILWNCRMPREYYGYAEAEFLDAVNAYNADHALDVSRYKGPTDHVWVEQKEAEAAAQGTGPVFYLGRRVRLESSEYFPDNGHRQSRITKITRKVTLPSQMDLEISNALSRTSLEKIGDDIGEARNYAATLFRGIAAPDLIRVGDGTKPTDNNLYSARRSHEEFLSKKSNDTAQGFIQFLAGIGIGPAETWGYVKKVTENGVEKVKSWFKNLWTDVLTVTNHLTGNGGLLNIKGNVAIAKDTANNKSGDISVAGAGNFGGGVSAQNGHFSGDVTADKGQFNDVTTHDLTVTGTAHFFELVIDSVKTAGGAAIFTPADGFKVEAVTKFFYDGSWRVRLWWKATDGEKAIKNMWRQGMQAICKNFNEAKPGQYSDVSNHNYWSVVAWTETLRGEDNQGTTPTWDSTNIAYEEGKPNPYEVTDWHILDLYSNADDSAERHPIPNYHLGGKPVYEGEPWTAAVGDNISQLGYRGDDNLLKNALYISAYTSLDTGDFTRGIRGLQAPLIAYYEGVDDFNLSAHRTTFKDALGGEWIGSMKVVVGDGQITLDEYINRVVDIDIDAEFYRLRALKEEAFVDASKKLTVNLEYQLEHVANGTATVMGAWDGFFIESINNAGTTEGSWSASGNRKIYRLSIGNYSEAQNPSYFVIQLKESATSNVIYTRVVRVAMKPGAIFEVTDGRIGAAVQAIGENMEQMRSEFEMTAQGIRSEVSNLPVSRNLLLNSDFAAMAETANGCIHLVPTTFWQGYQQESRNAQGEWVNRLVGGATYTLSFYARGKGRVGAVVHHTLLAGDTSQGNQSSMLEYLTPKPKLFTMTFTPSANCPFRVMIGSNSYGIGEEMPGTEIYISRPKLVRNSESATNLLTNPNLGNVAGGIPQGWTLWDNWESGSAAPVKTREIVPELYPPSTPVKWERWTNGDTGLSPSTNVGNLEDGVYPINIVPRSYWNGLAQRSYVREDADGWGGGAKVLKHDAWYTLSFEAKGTRSGVRAGFIIDCVNLKSGSGQFGNTVGGTAFEWDLTTSWRRYTYKFKAQANYDTSATDTDGYGFSLMLGLVNAISGTYTQNVIQIRCPQLEEGETATEWRRGEENTALMQTQFKQLSDRMELGVYRDGVKRSGMTLDEDGVEFDGERVKINGDLDLQGLTTENVHIAENISESILPTVINMGICATGNEVVKSVLVKPNNETPQTLVIRDPLNQTNGIDAVSCKVVVLPLWGSDFENWNSAITFNAGTGADDPLRGSFMLTRSRLYNGESMPDVARRVVPWRKSGTRVTVSNAAAESTMNWQSLMTEPIWNDDIETWSRNEPANNTTYYTRTRLSNIISHVRQLLGRAVLVCADPRILAYENIEASVPFTGMEDETTMHKAGCFSCAGWRSRFIILLPGQTLQLRSQITTSSTGSEVLTWVVENTEEFTPLSMTLSLAHGKYADSIDINYLGDAVYYPFNGGHAVLDTIVGHPLLKHVRKTFQAQAGVSQVFYTGGIELDFNIETN